MQATLNDIIRLHLYNYMMYILSIIVKEKDKNFLISPSHWVIASRLIFL